MEETRARKDRDGRLEYFEAQRTPGKNRVGAQAQAKLRIPVVYRGGVKGHTLRVRLEASDSVKG